MADSRMANQGGEKIADWDEGRMAETSRYARAGVMVWCREEAEKESFGGEVVGESTGDEEEFVRKTRTG